MADLTLDERKDLASLFINADKARCASEATHLQVAQQVVDCGAPASSDTPNRLTNACCSCHITSIQERFLLCFHLSHSCFEALLLMQFRLSCFPPVPELLPSSRYLLSTSVCLPDDNARLRYRWPPRQ